MSVQEFEGPPSAPEEDNTLRALHVLEERQAALFAAAAKWTRIPAANYLPDMQNAINASTDAFKSVVRIILEREDLDFEQRANSIGALLLMNDSERVEKLSRLTPTAKFMPLELEIPSFVEKAKHDTEAGITPESFLSSIIDSYSHNQVEDINKLIGAVHATRKGKAFLLAQKTLPHVIEISKNSIGVTLGSLMAYGLIKKFSD